MRFTTELTVSNLPSEGKPVIGWGAVAGATAYEIHIAASDSGSYYKFYSTGIANGSLTITSAKPGSVYYFKVRAISNGAEGPFSEAKIIHCALPRPDITVKNRASDGKPTISWTAVEGATGYEVYRCGTSGGTYTKLYTASATKLNVTHTGAVSGNTYTYKVRPVSTVNSKANGSYSTVKSVTVP